MSKVFSVRSNAIRNARGTFGKNAKVGTEFSITTVEGGYVWAPLVDAPAKPLLGMPARTNFDAPPEVNDKTPADKTPIPRKPILKPIRLRTGTKAKAPAKKAKGKKVAKKSLGGATVLRGKRLKFFNMVASKGGASLAHLCSVLGWQKHTVRGVVSTMNSDEKVGVTIKSYKTDTRGRVYQIA